MKRVVITGMQVLTSLGRDWETVRRAMEEGRSAVRRMPEWSEYEGLRSPLAAPIDSVEIPLSFDRKRLRGMGRVALLGTIAADAAIRESGLSHEEFASDKTGVAFGSCLGSSDALMQVAGALAQKKARGFPASAYLQVMSHTCAINIAMAFEVRGRVIPSNSACTSGSQAIGFAFEAIRSGVQEIMVAGGAEEMCAAFPALFQSMSATTSSTEDPAKVPRPFDVSRDGLVVGEGAGALILEELEHARARNATIFAEVIGFATNNDGGHITNPNSQSMERVMRLALESAQVDSGAIGYIHAHATGTELGDIAESVATERVFGPRPYIGATKSYLGHTLGGCGAIEAWLGIHMMESEWFAPILHLTDVDPRCGRLNYLRSSQHLRTDYVMNNNFAFGGVNTSLIFKRYE